MHQFSWRAFVTRLGSLGRRILAVLLSTLTWLVATWFLAAGVSVLLHPEFTNWHALPHFAIGIPLLLWAGWRFFRGLLCAGKPGVIARALVLSLVIVGVVDLIDKYVAPALNENHGEFTASVEAHTFNTIRWQVLANIEDFADFATFWNSPARLNDAEEREIVEAYFQAREQEQRLERDYDREGLDLEGQAQLTASEETRSALQDRAERILSRQVDELFKELGLDIPLLQELGLLIQRSEFRFIPRLNVLVVAERDKLEIHRSIDLDPELLLEDRGAIEAAVEKLGYSAIVVGIAGRGTTPSLVIPGSLQETLRVIAHEKIHVWFAFTELKSGSGPERRIIEETAASLLGDAIGDIVYCRFYDPTACEPVEERSISADSADRFDRRTALREIYLTVEQMLTNGQIDEAEAYMEERRVQMCEEHNYCERVLNQAFFAFRGGYADDPTFEDAYCGLGAKIQELWAQSDSVKEFFDTISDISSREELEIVLYGAIDETCNT